MPRVSAILRILPARAPRQDPRRSELAAQQLWLIVSGGPFPLAGAMHAIAIAGGLVRWAERRDRAPGARRSSPLATGR